MKNNTTNLPKFAVGGGSDTAHGGLLLLRQVLRDTGFPGFVNKLYGAPGSNRGHMNSTLLETLIVMLHAGCDRISDVRSFVGDCMFELLPSRQALEGFLSRMSRCKDKMERLLDEVVWHALSDQELPGPDGSGDTGRVVDIDEQVVPCEKQCSVPTYKGFRGLMHTLVFDSATGTVLALRLDPGNSRPGAGRTDVLDAALRRLGGRGISLLRADAAYYNGETINWCRENGAGFVIKARMDKGIKDVIDNIDEKAWRFVKKEKDGSRVEGATTLHEMGSCGHGFTLVVYRRFKADAQGDLFPAEHFAIATSLSAPCPKGLLRLYNRRGEDCENRIKEFGSDLAGLRPPSSRLGPNRAWMVVNAVAHNLFMLMRRTMFRGERPRLKRFRLMVYQVSCRLAKSGRETLLRVRKEKYLELVRWQRLLYEALAP